MGDRAFHIGHAGVAAWAGEEDINSCSIGIEIVNRGHDWGYPDFPLRQIAAVIALCRGIMLRRKVPSHRVLAHSDIAPSRKKDPGEKFPWHSLANSGVGHWVYPAPIVRGETLKLGTVGDDVRSMQEALKRYGYGIETRLTGQHETAPYNKYSYGVSDRGASVRIPWQVEVDQKGYIEDRRPNANMDPYVVTRLITNTVCSELGK